MEYEWDPRKAASNLAKHGVSFDEAASIFEDPMTYTVADPDHSDDESRHLSFGMTRNGRLLAVIHTHKIDTTRIINARKATRHERGIYEEG